MSYRRQSVWSHSYSGKTKVTIEWSNKSGAYAIKFHDTKHWNEMKIFIDYIKNFPIGERDYDAENKIWFLIEKHTTGFIEMIKMMPDKFELNYTEKPTGQVNMAVFVPVDVYLERFHSLTGEIVKDLDYDKAKKIYRRVCMVNHPDKGGDKDKMSSINECWSNLEMNYFHVKKEVQYA